MSNLEAKDSNGKKVALDILTKHVAVGEETQKAVIQAALKRVIVDKLVDPSSFTVNTILHGKGSVQLNADYEARENAVISNHALNQICKVTEIPKMYVNKLLTECVGMPASSRMRLLRVLFNSHLQEGAYRDRKNQPAKHLHRIMNGTLYGFLSRSYNRKLGTVAMLRPFLQECAEHGAKPVQSLHDELKTSIKYVLPVVFEPVDGEFVAFGATYTNSDFGAGGLRVSDSVMRITFGDTSVMEDKLRKIHLGALINESDLELSEETLAKESAAHMSAVRDSVRDIFSEKTIEQNLELIRLAAEHKITLTTLKAKARTILSKEELDKLDKLLGDTAKGIIDLPPVTHNDNGDPEANAWWASAALGRIASEMSDVERKVDVQELAGGLIK